MDTFFQDKFVLITGGSSGIGEALARQMAEKGANVAILARTKTNLNLAYSEIQKARIDGNFVEAVSADVTQKDELKSSIIDLIQKHGVPDILITCAGITHPGEFLEMTDELFRWQMDVNFFGTLYAIQVVTPGMVNRGSGIIVMLSSAVGYYNFYGYSAYGSSKYAVNGLAEALRMELKPHGIQVSVVIPGDTDTPQLAYEKKYKPEITSIITGTAGLHTADQTAADIIKGIRQRKYMIVPGGEAKILFFLIKLFGKKPFNAYFDWVVRKELAKQDAAKEQSVVTK